MHHAAPAIHARTKPADLTAGPAAYHLSLIHISRQAVAGHILNCDGTMAALWGNHGNIMAKPWRHRETALPE